jgi:hypothetical protein
LILDQVIRLPVLLEDMFSPLRCGFISRAFPERLEMGEVTVLNAFLDTLCFLVTVILLVLCIHLSLPMRCDLSRVHIITISSVLGQEDL